MVEVLDDTDVKILRYLAGREVRGEGPPTVREVAGIGKFKSSRTGRLRLEKLQEQGFVERDEAPSRKRRPVRLTKAGWEVVGEMPLLGRIAAGAGIDAVVHDDVYSLVAELASSKSGKRRYMLKASGQSMVGAGIEDGDELIIEEDQSPPDGTVVAALLGDEQVTVKRLYRNGDMVRLAPANPDYEDIVVRAEEVTVQGRVIRVLHPPRSR